MGFIKEQLLCCTDGISG